MEPESSSPSVPVARITHRLQVIARDPEVAERRTQARNKAFQELLALGEHWAASSTRRTLRTPPGAAAVGLGWKARLHHAVKDANLAHLIKVDCRPRPSASTSTGTSNATSTRCCRLRLSPLVQEDRRHTRRKHRTRVDASRRNLCPAARLSPRWARELPRATQARRPGVTTREHDEAHPS